MKEIERWVKISDQLIEAIEKYMKLNNLSLEDFSKEIRISLYALKKILNKNIKMTMTRNFFTKLANHINAFYVIPFEPSQFVIN